MTTYTTYVASDGEEFSSEEECLEHESHLVSDSGMLFFDSELQPIDVLGGAIYAAEDAFFFVVNNDELANAFCDMIRKEYGESWWPSAVSDGQAWMFDGDSESWVEIHSVIDSYNGILVQLGCSR